MSQDSLEPIDPSEPVKPAPSGNDEEPIAIEGGNEPLSLVDDSGESMIRTSSQKRTFGTAQAAEKKTEFKRPPNVDGSGATRCRIFHSKISLTPLEHLENQVNEWLDSEEIEVKHVGHVIGTMEGKRSEPNLVVMVWY